jgi:hypothetical protein
MSLKKTRQLARSMTAQKNVSSRGDNPNLTTHVSGCETDPALSPRDIANKLDEDWFRSHPSRYYRIRHAIPGEVPGSTTETYAVVRQRKPGFASPRYFDLDVALPRGEAPEDMAYDIYDRVGEQDGKTVAQMQVYFNGTPRWRH